MSDSGKVKFYKRDPDKNMNRFYSLDIQRDLFGNWCFIRNWGRAGTQGQLRLHYYSDAEAAESALEKHKKLRLKKHYHYA